MAQVIQVSSLVRLLQDVVEENFVDVLVQGELTSFSRPVSGHCYFSLKDQQARLRCAMFRPYARALRFKPEDGMEVICRGRVSVYPQRGDLQLIVESIEPVGAGDLQIAFDQLKAKLEQEGLFDSSRKQSLPAYPQTIGVITSATGAAIHDIINVLRRRSAGIKLLLYPVLVQGEGAAGQIASAITDMNEQAMADVLIVGRGGGSREDLQAFNEEVVARTIVASKIPVISAVGHEVDISIADLVADLRAATPSAAAEIVAGDRLEQERHLDQLTLRLAGQMRNRLELLQGRLLGISGRLRSPKEKIGLQQLEVERCFRLLQQAMRQQLSAGQQTLANLSGRLDAMSPLKVLGRGYAIARLKDTGQVLRDQAQVQAGDLIEVQLGTGQLDAVVKNKRG